MKKLYLSILVIPLLWPAGSLSAVTEPWEHLPLYQKADSLWSTIHKIYRKDPDSTITLSLQLAQIADEIKNDTMRAFSIRRLAWAHKQKKDLSQSIRYYFKLEGIYRQLGDIVGLGTANFNIGQIFAMAHEYDKASQCLELAKGYYEAAGQPLKASKALYELAKRYLEKNDPDTATNLLFEALDVCPPEEISLISMIYNRLGWATKDKKDYKKAREFYQKSLSPLDDSDKWAKKRSIANNNIGESYLFEEQYDKAIFYLTKALTIKETLKDSDFTLSTLVLLAKLSYQRGRYHEAFQWLDRGMSQVDPAYLSVNVNDALEFAIMMINDPENNSPIPDAALKNYINIQRQQFQALQDLKDSLDKYNIRAGEGMHAQEIAHEKLQASLNNKIFTVWGMATLLIMLLAALIILFAKKESQAKQEKSQAIQEISEDKEAFVSDQIKNYDQSILQMLIVKAGYEELKTWLKKDYGLRDDDLSF